MRLSSRMVDLPHRFALLVSILLSALPAQAANECHVVIGHYGDGATRRTTLTTTAVLSAGDVSLQALDWIGSLQNKGPHDVRVSFEGSPARQVTRGESVPSQGHFTHRVRLTRLECLLARSALSSPRRDS